MKRFDIVAHIQKSAKSSGVYQRFPMTVFYSLLASSSPWLNVVNDIFPMFG